MNSEMPFNAWTGMFSLIVTANIATTLILKKDNNCGILNYIDNLGQTEPAINSNEQDTPRRNFFGF